MMRVSVAIATYNGARYLGEQLDSIARQTLSPSEIIVCDDGSVDETLDIARRFSQAAPCPVRIMRNDSRLHFRANFMKAAQNCTGDLIAFCDQDDIWRADKLSTVVAAFADDDVLLVHHNARIFSADEGVTGLVMDGARPSQVSPVLSRTPFDLPPGFTQIFRCSLLPLTDLREDTIDFWAPSAALAHDQWVYLLALSLGKIAYVAEQLTDYRQHGDNLYGMKVERPSRWQRLKQRVTQVSDYGHLAVAFASFARALEAAATYPIGDVPARRAGEAALWFQALSGAYSDRQAAYAEESLPTRFAAWLSVRRNGRYGPGREFYFSDYGLLRDFVHGVCLAGLRSPPLGLSANDHSLRVASMGRDRDLTTY